MHSMADSCCCKAKPIQHCKAIILQIKQRSQEGRQQRRMGKSEGMFGGEGRASYAEEAQAAPSKAVLAPRCNQ